MSEPYPSWFFTLDSIVLIVLLAITIISFLVYFVEIKIIISFRKTTFRGPFYRLMLIGILVDMISAINLFTGEVIPARCWFVPFLLTHQNYLGKVFFLITYGGRCIQGATATILSFCRVFAVCSPVLYRKLAEPTSIYMMQGLQFSGALVASVMLAPDTYEYIFESEGYYSVGTGVSDSSWFFDFAAFMELCFVVCIVVNNLVTYSMFHSKRKRTTPKTTSISLASREKQSRESSLDRMTLIVCCVELIYFSFVVYALQINQNMDKKMFYFCYNILCVVYSTFSAWMLLIVSKPIYIEFMHIFSYVVYFWDDGFTLMEMLRITNLSSVSLHILV